MKIQFDWTWILIGLGIAAVVAVFVFGLPKWLLGLTSLGAASAVNKARKELPDRDKPEESETTDIAEDSISEDTNEVADEASKPLDPESFGDYADSLDDSGPD